MKYLLIIIILIKLLTFNVFAEWVSIGKSHNDTVEYYIDLSEIRKKNNFVYAWILANYAKPNEGIHSAKSLHELDCSYPRKEKILTLMFYSSPMGTEGYKDTLKPDWGWEYIDPNSIKETITNKICNIAGYERKENIKDKVENNEDNKLKVGNKLYLNANGGNPQTYFNEPLNLKNKIIEIGNEITGLKKSPYGRDFTTRATSKVTMPNGKIVTAKLDNFRNLKIIDDQGKILLENKVSGASSIYAFKHNNKTIAWGVGWHIYGKDKGYHETVDFTVLSTYIPILKEEGIKINYHYLRPNITEYFDAIKNSSSPVFSNAITVQGSSNAGNCYYCGLDFYTIDNTEGLKPIAIIEDFEKNNIDLNVIDPLVAVGSLTRSNCDLNNYYNYNINKDKKYFKRKWEDCNDDINKNKFMYYKNFIKKNYKEIINSAVEGDKYEQSYFTLKNCEEKGSYNYNPYSESVSDFLKRTKSDQKKILIEHFEKSCNLEKLYTYEMIAKQCFQMFEVFMFQQDGFFDVGMDICSN